MDKLNFPEYTFKIVKKERDILIFDDLRKKYLVLTPEEWVRQNLIKYLILDKGYPNGLISLEAGVKVNTLKKRYDALIYSKTGTPSILIECKAPAVKINNGVFQQILAYNTKIKAPYLLISNGYTHYFLTRTPEGKFVFNSSIPSYQELFSFPK